MDVMEGVIDKPAVSRKHKIPVGNVRGKKPSSNVQALKVGA